MLNQPPTSSPYTTITPLSSPNSATLLPINMLPSSIQQQSPQQYSSPIYMNYPMCNGISPNPVDGVLHLEEGASLPSIGELHPNRTLLTDNNKACSKKKSVDKTTTTLKQEDNIKRTMRGVVVLDQNSTMTTTNGGSMFNEKMKENTFDWKIQQQNGNNYTLLIPTTTGIKVQESSPQVQLNFNMNPYSSSVVSNNNGQTVQQQQFNSNNNNNSRVVRNTTSQLSQSQKLPSISEWFKDGNVVCRPSQQMTTATQPGINSAQQPQQNQPQQQQIQSPPPSQPTHVHRNQESTQPSQVIQSKSLWKFHQQQIPSMALDSQNNRTNNIVVPTTTCENSNTMSDHNINTGASTTKASLSENMQVGVTVDEKKKVKRGKAPVRIDTMSNKVNPLMYTNSNNIATSSCMDTSNDFQPQTAVNTTTITEPTHATSKSDPNIVLVIENVDSIKQYIAEKEQAQQQYASSSNHSRRISAKEVWNSIAAAAVETKSLIDNKIKKQHKMRTMSPLSIGSPSLTQAIFEKLTLDDSSAAGNMTQTNHNTLSPAYNGKQQQLQTQYLNNSDTTLNSHNNGGGRLGRNEFVDFSKGEHEIQRKTRGEKVYKFKMIKF